MKSNSQKSQYRLILQKQTKKKKTPGNIQLLPLHHQSWVMIASGNSVSKFQDQMVSMETRNNLDSKFYSFIPRRDSKEISLQYKAEGKEEIYQLGCFFDLATNS